MQNLTLENDVLNVNINTTGAELCGLFDKRDQTEHMWNASPEFWPRHAPILFPTVGESKDGKVTVNGKDYPMGRHGFVRMEEFSVREKTESKLVLELVSNHATRSHYPFEFIFRVGYELDGANLTQSFEVVNVDEEMLGFQLGGHPAFAVPFNEGEKYDDYKVCFDMTQTLDRHLLTSKGLYSGETRRFLDQKESFDLFYELFREDALVFKNIRSKQVWIQHKNGGKRLQIDYKGFPHLGIWSIPGANYVCIEPWIGCADSVGQSAEFFEKDSIIRLEPNEWFKAEFTVSLIEG